MRNILILNQSYTSNLGDIAIGESISAWVKDNGWNPITLPFWDETSVFGKMGYSKVSALLKTVPTTANIIVGSWIKEMIDGLCKTNKIDCAILGGGELFCAHRGFNAAFFCWVKELRARNIPCCVLGVSGDQNLSRVQIRRNKQALEQCFLIGVRDGYTRETFEKLYEVKAELAPDPVFLFDVGKTSEEERKNIVCVPVPSMNTFEGRAETETDADFYYRIIENNRNSDDHVVLTTTELRDQEYVEKLCQQINERFETAYEYRNYCTLAEFILLLKCTNIVISGRMHAMILGLLCGCLPYTIAFKQKLKVFDREYGNCKSVTDIICQTRVEYKRFAAIINTEIDSIK